MGAGIAAGGAEAGVTVRVKDTTLEALGRGLRYVREVFDERLKRRSLTRYEFAARMNRVSASLDYTGFRRTDLVIEAVFEDLDLKRKVLAEVEAATGKDCVFASNTSSLPIGDIAKDSWRPSRVLGMHFFSPVQKMPLLEVIVTPQTDAWATATAVQFGRRMGKHVIVVRDGPGFYTSRALAPYMNEAARLVEEGAAIEDIDRAMVAFGFPVGPITLLDEVGIDVGAKVAKILHHAFGERMTPPESMAKVLEDGRLGRKNKRGFYLYDDDGKKKGVDAQRVRAPARGRSAPADRAARDPGAARLRVPERSRALPAGRHPPLAARRRRGRDLRAGLPAVPGRPFPLPRSPGRALRGRGPRAAAGQARRPVQAGAASRRSGPGGQDVLLTNTPERRALATTPQRHRGHRGTQRKTEVTWRRVPMASTIRRRQLRRVDGDRE